MSVLVTGGSGFLGQRLIVKLVERGLSVTNLDLFEPPLGGPKATLILGDVRDTRTVVRALDGCTEVFHLAAAHHDFGLADETKFDVNVGGASVITKEMANQGISRVCFFSSAAVYGHSAGVGQEKSKPSPSSSYGASKFLAEEEFRRWKNYSPERSLLVLRPTVIFGPRNFANMYSLIRQISRGRYLQFGKGENIKSLVFVENAIDATLHLWDKLEVGHCVTANLVDKPDLTSREIAEVILQALGRRQSMLTIPVWLGKLLAAPFDTYQALTGNNTVISSARIDKFFSQNSEFECEVLRSSGFKASTTLEVGLRKTVDWFVEDGQFMYETPHIPSSSVVRSITSGANG